MFPPKGPGAGDGQGQAQDHLPQPEGSEHRDLFSSRARGTPVGPPYEEIGEPAVGSPLRGPGGRLVEAHARDGRVHDQPQCPNQTAEEGEVPRAEGAPVSEEWLPDPANAEAEPAARLATDAGLVRRIAEEGLGGRTWATLSRELAAFGSSVFTFWTESGLVFWHCREKDIGVDGPLYRRLQPDEVEELATETVAMGLTMFQRNLAAGDWEASRGASLRTYFIGQCLIQFSEVYGRWRRAAYRRARLVGLIERRPADFYPGDPSLALRRELEEMELSESVSISPTDRAIVLMKMRGYHHAEIAELVDLTEKAVESRLYRLRRRGVAWATDER